MAQKVWCPFAVKRKMPYNDRMPKREMSKTLILHTNGGGTDHGSLYGWFAREGNDICSHFQVAKDGTIEQYIGIDREAYAEYSGNAFGVSVETEDDGHPEHQWTSAQIRSIVKLANWLGVPGRVSPDGPGGGVGWHSLYSNWNQSAHNCPGSVRVGQIHTVILPMLQGKPSKHPHPSKPIKAKDRMLMLRNPVMKGDDVKALQRKLSTLGYKLTVDGVFGTKTASAVMAFQKKSKLTDDGVVGPMTRKALGL